MAFIIYKLARKQVIDGKLRTLGKHEQWYHADEKKDFHSQYGVVKKPKPGPYKLGNEELVILPAAFLDTYKTMKRRAQIITRKDIGFIIGYCGLGKESVVVESGAGSGGSTLMLGHVCKNVFSYEIEQENISIVKENIARVKLKNVTITHADFYDEKNVKSHKADLVLLDLPEPWRAYLSAKKTLKLGGYVVAYTPAIVQAAHFVHELPKEFLHERTVEIIDRDWKIEGEAIRPVSGDIGHTAFLTICRRIL